MLSRKVWIKTAKGEDEILTRKSGLPQNLRRVLILIDGVSDEMKVLQKGSVLTDDVPWCLGELARQDYICSVVPTLTIAAAKTELIRIAQETLGADSEKIVEKIREAPEDRDGLAEALKRCKKLVKMTIDEQKAEELIRKCSDVLEQLREAAS